MQHGLSSAELDRQYDETYEKYGRSLEQNHRGEFVAISADGEVVLGRSMQEVAQKAAKQFGPGTFLYKIGDRAVGRWR
ncbi:MAG TPA: hypothetical protein VFH48_14450 [Chloroflexota bacterium]|nr:hypothetical protein [Chloroflexota bacterium]